MDFAKLIDNAAKVVKENAPEILTGMAVVGVGTTSYLAAKAGYETADAYSHSPSTPVRQRLKQSWRSYIPAVLSGAGTVACIIFASKGNAKRTAAAVTAYSVTEKAFSEYREKVANEITERKEQKIRDEIAQDRVIANPPPMDGQVVVIGRDEVLCCELYTHRYFRSDMETLRAAVNDLNHWLNNGSYHVELGAFYDILGLPHTDVSDKLGWTDETVVSLEFSAVLTEDNRPCMAFRYLPEPKPLR